MRQDDLVPGAREAHVEEPQALGVVPARRLDPLGRLKGHVFERGSSQHSIVIVPAERPGPVPEPPSAQRVVCARLAAGHHRATGARLAASREETRQVDALIPRPRSRPAPGAAHLPGMIASLTRLPVFGVPVRSRALSGQDSLLSIVQMPAGVPVACVAIDGAANAALLAAQILATADADVARAPHFLADRASDCARGDASGACDIGFDIAHFACHIDAARADDHDVG